MARLLTLGFEQRSVTAGVEFDSNTGTPTIDTTNFYVGNGGSAAMRVNGAAISKFLTHQYCGAALAQDRFWMFRMRIATSTNVASSAIALFRDGTNGNGLSLRLNTDNTLQLWDEQAGVQRGSNSVVLTANTYYRIELQYNRAAGTGTAYLNGVQFATGVQSATLDMNIIRLGMIDTATCDISYDDVIINDSSGTSETGLPGNQSIVHLKPNAAGDNNAFTVQVGGTVGSANNFTRVNEITPDDATTYNGDVTATDTDDFNVDDTGAGIGASDTINVVSVIVRYRALVAAAEAAFKVRVKKAAAGTVSSSAAITPNSTTWKTNANTAPITSPLILYADPDGSTWTKATLDTAQVGYNISTTNTNAADISTIHLQVSSTPVIISTASESTLLMMGV